MCNSAPVFMHCDQEAGMLTFLCDHHGRDCASGKCVRLIDPPLRANSRAEIMEGMVCSFDDCVNRAVALRPMSAGPITYVTQSVCANHLQPGDRIVLGDGCCD